MRLKATFALLCRIFRTPILSWLSLFCRLVKVMPCHSCRGDIDVLEIFQRKIHYCICVFFAEYPVGWVSRPVPAKFYLMGHIAQRVCDLPLCMNPINHFRKDHIRLCSQFYATGFQGAPTHFCGRVICPYPQTPHSLLEVRLDCVRNLIGNVVVRLSQREMYLIYPAIVTVLC